MKKFQNLGRSLTKGQQKKIMGGDESVGGAGTCSAKPTNCTTSCSCNASGTSTCSSTANTATCNCDGLITEITC